MEIVVIGNQGEEIGRIINFDVSDLDYEARTEAFLQRLLDICGG